MVSKLVAYLVELMEVQMVVVKVLGWVEYKESKRVVLSAHLTVESWAVLMAISRVDLLVAHWVDLTGWKKVGNLVDLMEVMLVDSLVVLMVEL